MGDIIAISGSNRPMSITRQYIETLLQKCSFLNSDISFEVISAPNCNIQLCRGCLSCFLHGECPLDEYDEMREIKEKLLSASFVIWGSPVYLHQVPGGMKVLLDRIAYWTHIFALVGKPGLVVVSAGNNGMDAVADYLNWISDFLGLDIIRTIRIWEEDGFDGDQQMNELAKEVAAYVLNKKKCTTSMNKEAKFQIMKQLIEKYDEESFEFMYWREKGMLLAKDYASYLEHLRLGV